MEIDMNDKRVRLYVEQKELLDGFLGRGAITEAQYNKSLGDLTEKMGMREVLAELEKLGSDTSAND